LVKNKTELASGLLFIAFGVAFLALSLQYGFGTARRLGPAVFPVILAAILIGLGAIVCFSSLASDEIKSLPKLDIRGAFLILAPIAVFGATIRGGGLVVAVPAIIAISSLAGRSPSFMRIALSAVLTTAFCVTVFRYGLGLPIPVLGSWFGKW